MLLLCAPLGILAAKLNWGPIAVFCLNFGALVPLALILGEVSTVCTTSAGAASCERPRPAYALAMEEEASAWAASVAVMAA